MCLLDVADVAVSCVFVDFPSRESLHFASITGVRGRMHSNLSETCPSDSGLGSWGGNGCYAGTAYGNGSNSDHRQPCDSHRATDTHRRYGHENG
jgi:hypothetical protein